MASSNLTLVTEISGVINGSAFTADGGGTWNASASRSSSRLSFDHAIDGFIPILCATWSCKHHPKLAEPRDGEKNPFSAILDAGATIGTVLTMTYPFGNDRIVAIGRIDRAKPGEQRARQTRVGWYSGPLDIIEQEPFAEHFSPAGPGRATGRSARTVRRANGSSFAIAYEWQISFPSQFALDKPFVVEYAPDSSWDSVALEMSVEMGLSAEVRSRWSA
jgi:hypothetical protein